VSDEARGEIMTRKWETYEDILADLRADRPAPPPTPKSPAQRLAECGVNKPTEAVIQDVTNANNALNEHCETMDDRRRKQIAKELAEHNAESPIWQALVHWRLSVDRAEERVRALDGEIPERGIYDPIKRFEREMRGR
jgi:hypothetical protein